MPPPFKRILDHFWWHYFAEDRRIYPRLQTHNLVRYYYPVEERIERISNLINLSPAGFQFTFKGLRVQAGELFRVVINFTQSQREIETIATVCWHKRNGGRNSFFVGAVFKNLQEDDQRFLHHYMLRRHKNLLHSWLFLTRMLPTLGG